jgi:ferredoxin
VRIEVDRQRCEGHGMCEVVAPQYFALDEEGNLTVLAADVAADDEENVRDASMACPVAALRLA